MDAILKILEKVVPSAVLALVGIFLLLQEKRIRELREDIKDLKLDKKDLREDKDSQRLFYESQRASYENQINRLTDEKKCLDDRTELLIEKREELRQKLESLGQERLKESIETRELIEKRFGTLQSSVESLPQEDANQLEVEQIKKEIEAFREPLKLLEQYEEKAKAWLQDIEELSTNKKTWAEEADEYARNKLNRQLKKPY